METVSDKPADSRVRRFYLLRHSDATGTSGVGIVAYGVVLPSGRVAIEWVSRLTSVALYDSLEVLEAIHGHEGRTEVVMID